MDKICKGSDVEKICKILNVYDPEGLIKMGAPEDEYAPEARVLLQRVVNQPLTAQYVRDVWFVFFATGSSQNRGPHFGAATIYIGEMPMRPEFENIARAINDLYPQRA